VGRKEVDAAQTRIAYDPADRQRRAAVRIHLHGHLVVRTAYAAGLNFQQRLGVLHRFLEELQGFVATLRFKLLHRVIEDVFGSGLLAVPHHRVDKLRNQRGVVNRIRQNFTL
jgi:hypothetical protein